MPAWLANLLGSILSQFGLPALKQLLVLLLTQFEAKYPGVKPLVDAVIAFIENGGSPRALHAHLASNVVGFPQPPLTRV